jgi:hypothetical protein
MKARTAAVLALLTAARIAGAETSVRLDMGLVSGAVSADAARRVGIGERGYGVLLGAGLGRSSFIVGLDATFELIEDRAIFTQPTTSGTLNSSTAVYDFGFYGGARKRFGSQGTPLIAGVNAGYNIAFGLRMIDFCDDCFQEKLPLKDGFYLEPGLAIGMARGWQMGASFRVYAGSDFRNMVLLRATKAY